MTRRAPRLPLPVDDSLPALLADLDEHGAVVLKAPTGAGKTTRVPPALAHHLGEGGAVIVVEPRRVAARAAADRVARELGARLGREVGYRIRFEDRSSSDTRILFVTEGVLLRMLQGDPFLEGIAALVFDEFHERNLASDLGLAMARRVRSQARPDLRLVVMSATLDPEPLAEWLEAGVVETEGRLYPVEVQYLPRPDDRRLDAVVQSGIRRALEHGPGDVLVFLPGRGEIARLEEQIDGAEDPLCPDDRAAHLEAVPLYGDLSVDRQRRALEPTPAGAPRRVILATNVAETSVTVSGVTAVVDSGLARVARYDPGYGLDRLELERISQASARQRAGRAGRERPGLCLRLWTEGDQASRRPETTPEIRRVDLSSAVLQLLVWGEPDPETFPWFEPPEPARLEVARTLLRRLGAVDRAGVTARGRHLAGIGVHPRLGRLLLAGAEGGWLQRASLAAALLEERDPFERWTADGNAPATRSDLLDRVEAVETAAGGRGSADRRLRRRRMPGLIRVAERLERQVERLGVEASATTDDPDAEQTSPPAGEEALLRGLLLAYPDRLARRRSGAPDSRDGHPRRAVLLGGSGVVLGPGSGVGKAPLFVCLRTGGASRRTGAAEAIVHLASEVQESWLGHVEFGDLAVETRVVWDEEAQRVTARELRLFRSEGDELVLSEAPAEAPSGPEAEVLLTERALADPGAALALDDPAVEQELVRWHTVAVWRPELEIPVPGDHLWQRLVPALVPGHRSFAELRRAPLLDRLRDLLPWSTRRAIDRLAPKRIRVASDRSFRLEYRDDGPPILAARIQQLFGVTETPRVNDGRTPVLLHLLAPNGRPQQITDDLAGFWSGTYADVKRDLAGRYPKHSWPEDPARAEPPRRGSRRRSRRDR